jgi:D-3-phosphoglycerate dehydrogenase
LGRERPGGRAVSFIAVDDVLVEGLLQQILALPGVLAARMLHL